MVNMEPWQPSQFILMEPQPKVYTPTALHLYETQYLHPKTSLPIPPPYSPGERVYRAEQWRVTGKVCLNDGFSVSHMWCWVQYRDGVELKYAVPKESIWDLKVWQPASTMPPEFARKFCTITSCVPKQYADMTDDEYRALGHMEVPERPTYKELSDMAEMYGQNKWGWLVEKEDEV